jgi:hypothetical protein
MPDEMPPAPGDLTANPGDPILPIPSAEASTQAGPTTSGRPAAEPRPTDLDPAQMGFTPRRAVPWLSPVLLAGTAVRVVLAELFGAYLDKRELQNSLPGDVFDERSEGPEVWFDYVADLGDGFNPTYTVAYLVAQPELQVDGHTLPRGEFVILGGDQVYPTASGQQYEDRFKGPYRAALPQAPVDGDCPTLYALPGNHDWYDGLTAFLRLFTRGENGRIGGWATRQSRSYFAVQLPQRWWLFAIDAQFGAYLDDPQLRYFAEAAKQVQPGDRIILCPPKPNWVEAVEDRKAYDTIDYFVRTILQPTGADVRVMIAGDLHHYARYSNPRRQLITAGGGGAYLYPTNHLPRRLMVPPRTSFVRNQSPPEDFKLAAAYPSKAKSRRLAWGVFPRMLWRNGSFVALLGLIHMLLMLTGANAVQQMSSAEARLVTIPTALMIIITLGGTVMFAMPRTAGQQKTKHWILGLLHGVAHLGLATLGTWLWLQLPLFDLTWPLPIAVAIVLYLPLAAIAASLLVSMYLLIASVFYVNENELFAAQGIQGFKHFLRIHIDRDGSLTIYAVAIDRINRRWRAAPQKAPDSSWFEPVKPIKVRLVEPPVRIG